MKRNRLISLCLMLAMLLGVFTFAPSLESRAYAKTDAVEDAQESVVRVIVFSETGGGTGSGFAVGSRGNDVEYIVTNHHVVKKDMNNVYVTTTDIDGKIKAEVIYYDAEHDFAILELEEKLDDRKPIALLSPKELHKSQNVYCIGFPGLSDYVSENYDYSSRIGDMTITSGVVSNPQYEDNKGKTCIMSDAKINGGNSGGPMVDEHGQAVGINTSTIAPNEELANNMTLAVSIDYVIKKLDALDIDFIEGNADGRSSSKFADFIKNNLIYILIGTVAVAVLVLALVFMRSNKKPAAMSSKSVEPPTDRSPVNIPNYPPPPPPQRMLVVRCECGPFQGKAVRGMSVRIGRTPNCQLIFPSGTPCVSREHCMISFDGHNISVTDLGSSYGTILSSGERLSAGQFRNIREGDLIFIGSNEVVVSVRLG